MGKCGNMWGDMGNVCTKFSDQFCQSIFSEDNLAFLANYFEAPKIAIASVLPTVGLGRFRKMLEKVKRCGDRALAKQTI